ncbi:helix-turn-helix transcriptional regulator [Bilophila wadsworthia]|jgi:predicted DNA-binding transcriptional regulator AlpA|uniref:helix-turn-helix transcriptional regulator n=1 Tax=Bilophila wadsworthia TaxID=35833 RepID=UPI0024203CB3|nr:AlpA family phage regulatory protein [Bilophila wadsworthia]
MPSNLSENAFLRLPQVLALIPISKSAWWAGCKTGRYPKPIKLSPRTTAWRSADIAALVERLSKNEGEYAKQ